MMATAIAVTILIMKVITVAVKAKVAIATVVVMTMKALIEIGHSKPNSNDRNDDNKQRLKLYYIHFSLDLFILRVTLGVTQLRL